MQIYGPSALHGAQSINAPHMNRVAANSGLHRSSAPSDELQLSDKAQLASRMADIPDIRADRVASIRASIADGTYETSGRMSMALDRLLDEIG